MFGKLRSTDAILICSSLLIAYFIWVIANMRSIEQVVLDGVPVTIAVPPHIELQTSRQTVAIEVRFPKRLRREIRRDAFLVRRINDSNLVRQAGTGDLKEVTVTLLDGDVECPALPRSVEVIKVDPRDLRVWVRIRTAPAHIVPRLENDPAPGYRLEKWLVSQPDAPLLSGSQERLDSQEEDSDGLIRLKTSSISLLERRESFTTSVAIVVPEGLNLLDRNTGQRLSRDALVQVLIKEEETTRTVGGILIRVPVRTANLEAKTRPTSATVTIVGPRSLVESLDTRTIELRPKSLPEETPGFEGEVAIEARMEKSVSPNVRVVGVRPEKVLLRYELKTAERPTTPTTSPP